MITIDSFAMGVIAFSQALMLVLWLGVLLDDFGKSKADKTFGRNGTIFFSALAVCNIIIVGSAIITQFTLTKTTVAKSVATEVVYDGKNPDAVSITQTRTPENDPYDQKTTTYSPTDTQTNTMITSTFARSTSKIHHRIKTSAKSNWLSTRCVRRATGPSLRSTKTPMTSSSKPQIERKPNDH